MKQKLFGALKLLLTVLIAGAAAYFGRLCALAIIERAVKTSGINGDNLSYAPALLRYAVQNADQLAAAVALSICIACLLFLVMLFPGEKAPFRLIWVHMLIGGLACGWGLVRRLELADEIRYTAFRSYGSVLMYLIALLYAVAAALLMRRCLYHGARQCFGRLTAIISGALSEGVLWGLVYGLSPFTFINGALAGLLFGYLYEAISSPVPEMLLRFGWTVGAGMLGAYPYNGGYAVSKSLWAGGNHGLQGSLSLAVFMAFLGALAAVLKFRKRHVNG